MPPCCTERAACSTDKRKLATTLFPRLGLSSVLSEVTFLTVGWPERFRVALERFRSFGSSMIFADDVVRLFSVVELGDGCCLATCNFAASPPLLALSLGEEECAPSFKEFVIEFALSKPFDRKSLTPATAASLASLLLEDSLTRVLDDLWSGWLRFSVWLEER